MVEQSTTQHEQVRIIASNIHTYEVKIFQGSHVSMKIFYFEVNYQ